MLGVCWVVFFFFRFFGIGGVVFIMVELFIERLEFGVVLDIEV